MYSWGIVRQRRVEMQENAAGFPIPETLFEHVLYTQEIPYCIEYQRYEKDTMTRPHYAHTLEVIISFGVQGDYNIGGISVPLKEDGILFIPPDVIHSGILYLPKPAHLINLKFDLEQLRSLVDIEHIYARAGYSIRQLISCRPNREKTIRAVQRLIDADDDLFERTAALIHLFGIWAKGLSELREAVICTDSLIDDLIR